MSELLDKQVNAQKEKTSGVHTSSRKPTKKVCDENERNKEEKNDARYKNIIDGRRAFIGYLWKTHAMDINQLQVDDCWYNEGTICLVNELMGAWGDSFSSVSAQMGVIKLAMAGTQDWWRLISSIVGLLILYG